MRRIAARRCPALDPFDVETATWSVQERPTNNLIIINKFLLSPRLGQ
ncbi:MAG: hypothetical protein V3V49_02660 [Candidatus Krumholzibacteria bacterium]